MREAKELNVSLNTRSFTIDIAIEEEGLIETIFKALREYVERGFALKVRESYITSLSDSLKIITRIISAGSQMDEWRGDTKQLLSIIRKSK
jgi:hypothetical protein